MSDNASPHVIVRKASNEPVAVAGAVRALIYTLLGTRGLDPSILTLIVICGEALVSLVLRRFVSPVATAVTEPSPPPPHPSEIARDDTTAAATG